jgi:hypothetical protein
MARQDAELYGYQTASREFFFSLAPACMLSLKKIYKLWLYVWQVTTRTLKYARAQRGIHSLPKTEDLFVSLLHDRPVGLAGDKLNTVTTHNPQCMMSPRCTPNIFNFHWQVYGPLYSTTVSAMTHEYPQLSLRVWLLKTLCCQNYSHLSMICRNAHSTKLTEVQASFKLFGFGTELGQNGTRFPLLRLL